MAVKWLSPGSILDIDLFPLDTYYCEKMHTKEMRVH